MSCLFCDIVAGTIESKRVFPDHYLYRRDDVGGLDPDLLWVTTAKDAVKIPAAWTGATPVWVLEEEVRPLEEGRLLSWLVRELDGGSRS